MRSRWPARTFSRRSCVSNVPFLAANHSGKGRNYLYEYAAMIEVNGIDSTELSLDNREASIGLCRLSFSLISIDSAPLGSRRTMHLR